jgi:PAS domain S-box-containing protein
MGKNKSVDPIDEKLFLASMVESSADAIIGMTPEGVITYWNPAAEKLYGYKRGEVWGESISVLAIKDAVDPTPSLLARIKKKEAIEHYQTIHQRKDGKPVFVFLTVSPIVAKEGDLVGAAAIAHDLTKQKEMESELKKKEIEYRSLFENMAEGFAYCEMLFDDKNQPTDFIYLAVNKAFEQLTGLQNVVGKKVTAVIPGIREQYPELFETYGRVSLTGKTEKIELNFKPISAWLSISVYSPEKKHFVAVFENITKQKETEAELKELKKLSGKA